MVAFVLGQFSVSLFHGQSKVNPIHGQLMVAFVYGQFSVSIVHGQPTVSPVHVSSVHGRFVVAFVSGRFSDSLVDGQPTVNPVHSQPCSWSIVPRRELQTAGRPVAQPAWAGLPSPPAVCTGA